MIYKIKNATLIDSENIINAEILFNNKIIAIDNKINQNADIEIDANGMYIFPGCIDPHVHFRTPGMEYKEDFESGGNAALAGGVTTVFDMPNTIPPVFNNEILQNKINIINKISPINYAVFFCGNNTNLNEIQNVKNVPGIKLFLNDTTGHLLLENRETWKEIFKIGKKITLHAEGDTFLEAIRIWEKLDYPCSIHLAHMTLKKEILEIKRLKNNPKSMNLISCEVCPHHLFFNKLDVKANPFLRMKPELAEESDRLALWQAIEEGYIDCFATDHAPHLIEEKQKNPPTFGVPGIEHLFILIYTEWKKRNWDLKKLSAMMSLNTLKIYNVKNLKAKLKIGYDADLFLIDPNKNYKISELQIFSKCNWTPYSNFNVNGLIKKTFVNGNLVFDENKFYLNNSNNKQILFN